MKEKISLSVELKDVSQEKLDLITRYQNGLIPELGNMKESNNRLSDKILSLEKELQCKELSKIDLLKERDNMDDILKISRNENVHLKQQIEEIASNQLGNIDALAETRAKQFDTIERDKGILEKDLQFFKMKSERLEQQLLEKEKYQLRIEADSKYGTDQALQALKSENQMLRDERLILERKVMRLQSELSENENASSRNYNPDEQNLYTESDIPNRILMNSSVKNSPQNQIVNPNANKYNQNNYVQETLDKKYNYQYNDYGSSSKPGRLEMFNLRSNRESDKYLQDINPKRPLEASNQQKNYNRYAGPEYNHKGLNDDRK